MFMDMFEASKNHPNHPYCEESVPSPPLRHLMAGHRYTWRDKKYKDHRVPCSLYYALCPHDKAGNYLYHRADLNRTLDRIDRESRWTVAYTRLYLVFNHFKEMEE